MAIPKNAKHSEDNNGDTTEDRQRCLLHPTRKHIKPILFDARDLQAAAAKRQTLAGKMSEGNVSCAMKAKYKQEAQRHDLK